MVSDQRKIAIVGAGISGLACARVLSENGMQVVVFEKSRGVGGRMATRRAEGDLQFDHGAQYFTVRDTCFQQTIDACLREGLVAAWTGRVCTLTDGVVDWKDKLTPRYVGVPGMNAICKHLAHGLDIRFQTRVAVPVRDPGGWKLFRDDGQPLGTFDYFLTSAPAPQSAELLSTAPGLQHLAAQTVMHGCWAAMVSFDHSLDLPFDGAFVHQSPLSWIARNDSKPGRARLQESWVLHASPSWTDRHIEADGDVVLAQLLQAFWQATAARPVTPNHASVHRWRYAIPAEPLDQPCLLDAERRIGACGDWCGGPRVEGAFLSGTALAGHVMRCEASC